MATFEPLMSGLDQDMRYGNAVVVSGCECSSLTGEIEKETKSYYSTWSDHLVTI